MGKSQTIAVIRVLVCQVYHSVVCAFNLRHGNFRPFVSKLNCTYSQTCISTLVYKHANTHTISQNQSERKEVKVKKSNPFPFLLLHHHLLSVSLFGVVSSAKAVYILRQSHYRSDLCRLALNMRHPPQDNAIENDSREKKQKEEEKERAFADCGSVTHASLIY